MVTKNHYNRIVIFIYIYVGGLFFFLTRYLFKKKRIMSFKCHLCNSEFLVIDIPDVISLSLLTANALAMGKLTWGFTLSGNIQRAEAASQCVVYSNGEHVQHCTILLSYSSASVFSDN